METQKRWCKRNAQATNTRLGCYMVLKNSKGEQEGWCSNTHIATGVKKLESNPLISQIRT